MLNRYPILKDLLDRAVSKRFGLRKEFARVAKGFIIECLLAMEKKLLFDDNILIKSQAIFLDSEFTMQD